MKMGDNRVSKEELRLMALELEMYESGMAKPGDYAEPIVKRTTVKIGKAVREAVFKLKAKDYDNSTIANELGVSEVVVESVIERDRQQIKSDQKLKNLLEMYKDGYTLEELGQKHSVTRERIRQLIKREIGNQMGYGPMEQRYRKTELTEAVRAVVQIAREDRQGDAIDEKLKIAEVKGVDPNYFDSIRKYCEAVGVTTDSLKVNRPDIYNILKINQNRAKQKWNKYYDACRMCGLTVAKYRSNGYCENCYAKSPEWKEMVKRSYQRNKDTRSLANKKFREKYVARPEIAAKLEREYDLKFFGGNRKSALERDGYKCLGCGMSTDVKDTLGRTKVRIWHLNGDNQDNSIDNLGTYCQSCLYKRGLGRRWDSFNKSRRNK